MIDRMFASRISGRPGSCMRFTQTADRIEAHRFLDGIRNVAD